MPVNKIAFIHPYQLRLQRGIEAWLWHLALALAKDRLEVHILTWDGPLEPPAYSQHPNLVIKRVPSIRYFQHLLAAPFYLAYLVRGSYDHVIVNFASYGEGLALSLYRSFKKLPFSLVLHFPHSLVPHRYREFLRWRFHERADYIIAVSSCVAAEAQALFQRACAVIGHGVASERFRPDHEVLKKIRRDIGISEDTCVLISVSAFEERKGIQCVIRAMPVIQETIDDLYYLVIGDGPYRQALEALVIDLGLQDRVLLLGTKLDVVPYYQMADIFFALSSGEASSISTLEALSSGLPVIVSDEPPFDELVDSACGHLVNKEDVDAVASATIHLWANQDQRLQMGQNATAQATKQHDWGVIAKQYRDLLESQSE